MIGIVLVFAASLVSFSNTLEAKSNGSYLTALTAEKTPLQLCVDACFETFGRPSAELKSCVSFCQKRYAEAPERLHAMMPPQNGLQQIVLGVNLDPSESQFSFPCSTYANSSIVSCGMPYQIEDNRCQSTIEFLRTPDRQVQISCSTKNGKKVILGKTTGALYVDQTQDAFGFVRLQLSSNVSVQGKSMPGRLPKIIQRIMVK